jgi:hypothetical protein
MCYPVFEVSILPPWQRGTEVSETGRRASNQAFVEFPAMQMLVTSFYHPIIGRCI